MFATSRLLWLVGLLFSFSYWQAPFLSGQDLRATAGDIEVQTRGAVHEAFAQPFDPGAEPGLAVPKEPPPVIPEMPPEERPEGNNVQWIGGYWSWDADRNDFVWISGTYRESPPGRQFVPGRWVHTDDGWHWIPGFWAPEGDITYAQEQPPAPLETAPSFAPPDDNSMYVPGYWAYDNSAFAWRPGYYARARAGRLWVSPRYVWTPTGYIFVGGYWDYPLADRGLLFAPVVFNRPLWRTPGWSYRPGYVVAANALLDSLFWRPRTHHYYFGNYFGPGYARLGYQPWFAGRNDPLFNYYRWDNRGNSNWAANQQRNFNDRAAGRLAAPPMNFAKQNTRNRTVTPLSHVANTQKLTRAAPVQHNVQRTQIHRPATTTSAKPHVTHSYAAPKVVHHAATVKGPAVSHYRPAPVHHAAPAHTHASRPPVHHSSAHHTPVHSGGGRHGGRR